MGLGMSWEPKPGEWVVVRPRADWTDDASGWRAGDPGEPQPGQVARAHAVSHGYKVPTIVTLTSDLFTLGAYAGWLRPATQEEQAKAELAGLSQL